MRRMLLVALLVAPLAARADDDRPRLAFGADAARSMSFTWNTNREVGSLIRDFLSRCE